MKYSKNNAPITCMMTNSTCYKGTRTMTPKGILWHSTGANNTWIMRYVQPSDNAPDRAEMLKLIGTNKYKNDWNHIERQAGVNAWVGKLADGTVAAVQTLPWNYRPWGCGTGKKGSCNDTHINFEICEDNLSDAAYFNKVYKEACELTAYLCELYKIDPKGTIVHNGVTVPTILCHADSYKLGLGSNHGDVLHWFKKHGKTMDDVRNDVAALMKKPEATKPVVTTTIKAGDVVKITSGATYYSGKAIPSWVKNTTWIVREVAGDRAVIDKSENGKYSICSAINVKYLTAAKATQPVKKTVEEIAKEVIAGKWGNGTARKNKLVAAGYDYNAVQKAVNNMLSGNTKKSLIEIAKEVILGKWGNGATRKKKLEDAGYDYEDVQDEVNELLKK